ncbi:phosphate signaling complex protein PhoU [Macrococcus equipercicus]|uniref:Phosphate-specific transport system accessory protein PhoU n=2 Tax=Macrococcus equipercicus TaxID=69967 RepID=A0A9Q9BRU0_9STAP|nr:phosphate signaling complex protein PhoU [Macrococcus equipercicus]
MSLIRPTRFSLTLLMSRQNAISLDVSVDMREKYEESLNDLIESVIKLAEEVYHVIERSLDVLNCEDVQEVRELIKHDLVINDMENAINEQVIRLITKQQPIATDLRIIMASIKIASELERMGDNAGNLAKIRRRVKFEDTVVLSRLKTMGKLSLLMLYDLRDAFQQKDVNLTKEVIDRDQDIDDLYKEIVNTTYLIDNDPFISGQAHLAARYLERIGDHITNIAENIYYFITGDRYDKFLK